MPVAGRGLLLQHSTTPIRSAAAPPAINCPTAARLALLLRTPLRIATAPSIVMDTTSYFYHSSRPQAFHASRLLLFPRSFLHVYCVTEDFEKLRTYAYTRTTA
jgi:hypothetical protein